MAERVLIDPADPDPEVVRQVAQLLWNGEVVAAPSDTVYGLLAEPRDRRARETLTKIKGRPGPFIVLVASWEQAGSWTRGLTEDHWLRLRRVWPGPVTVILPTHPDMPGAENASIGLRMPRNPFLRGVIEAAEEPLFSTSANLPGEPPPVSAGAIAPSILDSVALVVDGGPADSVAPSTIVDWSGRAPRVIREGRGDATPLLDQPDAP